MILRQFNRDGIKAFRAFLAEARMNPRAPLPSELLEDDSLSECVSPEVQVEPQSFTLRSDATDYLTEILKPLSADEVSLNDGLWTWLTLFYFEQVCPSHAGQRKVKNDYYYVFESRNMRHFYRHLLFVAWHAARIAHPFHRLYMASPVSSLDKVTEEVMKKLYLTRIPCIFETLDKLYWDENRQRARVGIVDGRTVRPGDLVRRFPIRIQQLEKTYDLFSLTADQLIDLLGEEFRSESKATARE